MKSNPPRRSGLAAGRPLALAAILSILPGIPSALAQTGYTSYYWNTTGPGNVQSNWGANPDGSGGNPGNFGSAQNLRLTIQSGQDLDNFSGNWAVTGSNSQVVVKSGGAITAGSQNLNIVLNLESGATYRASSTYSNLKFGVVDAASTFVFGGSLSSIRDLSYGNFDYNSTATGTDAATLNASGNLTVRQGTLRASAFSSSGAHVIGGGVTILAGAVYDFGTSTTPGYTSTIHVGGDFVNQGTFRNSSSTLSATLAFDGAGSSAVTWGSHSGLFNVEVASGKTVVFTDSLDTAGGGLTVDGELLLNGGQSVATGAGAIVVSGRLSGAASSDALMTLGSSSGVSFLADSTITLALGANGAHGVLARSGSGLWSFAADQAFLFLDLGASAGTTYDNLITGLASDPGVSGWTIANEGWVGVFTFDGANVDLTLQAIPEPGATAFLAAGMAAGLFCVRRRSVALKY